MILALASFLFPGEIFNHYFNQKALGCLLYNICYYISPFETTGQLAILNGKYDMPEYPLYSNEIKNLIGS